MMGESSQGQGGSCLVVPRTSLLFLSKNPFLVVIADRRATHTARSPKLEIQIKERTWELATRGRTN